MWVIKRSTGQSVDVTVCDYKYVVKLTKVVGGAHAWLSVAGDSLGPLPVGHSVIIQDTYTAVLTILKVTGKTVTLGFDAAKEVVLQASEKAKAKKDQQ